MPAPDPFSEDSNVDFLETPAPGPENVFFSAATQRDKFFGGAGNPAEQKVRPLVPEPLMPPSIKHNLAEQQDIRYHSGGQPEQTGQTPAERAVQDHYGTAKKDSVSYEVLNDEVRINEEV